MDFQNSWEQPSTDLVIDIVIWTSCCFGVPADHTSTHEASWCPPYGYCPHLRVTAALFWVHTYKRVTYLLCVIHYDMCIHPFTETLPKNHGKVELKHELILGANILKSKADGGRVP